MVNVALLSKWHVHAVDYAREAFANPNIVVKKVWDEAPARGEEWSKELDVPFESDLEKIWADPEIHAVIVTTPTTMHKVIMIAAAKAKKHIFSRKRCSHLRLRMLKRFWLPLKKTAYSL